MHEKQYLLLCRPPPPQAPLGLRGGPPGLHPPQAHARHGDRIPHLLRLLQLPDRHVLGRGYLVFGNRPEFTAGIPRKEHPPDGSPRARGTTCRMDEGLPGAVFQYTRTGGQNGHLVSAVCEGLLSTPQSLYGRPFRRVDRRICRQQRGNGMHNRLCETKRPGDRCV